MGFFPIFIALAGLILLYSLFTYNQIKPKKAALTQVIDEMAEVSRERKGLVLAHDRENENSPLKEAAADLMKTSTDRFQSFRKENELIEKTNQGASNLNNAELKGQIETLNSKQQALMKKLQHVADDYNTFIKKPPTSFVASIFSFKPF